MCCVTYALIKPHCDLRQTNQSGHSATGNNNLVAFSNQRCPRASSPPHSPSNNARLHHERRIRAGNPGAEAQHRNILRHVGAGGRGGRSGRGSVTEKETKKSGRHTRPQPSTLESNHGGWRRNGGEEGRDACAVLLPSSHCCTADCHRHSTRPLRRWYLPLRSLSLSAAPLSLSLFLLLQMSRSWLQMMQCSTMRRSATSCATTTRST